MVEISSLKYPKKSHHRKEVVLPKHSKDLAEFFGIMMGDGGINNPWQAKITLNSVKDLQYSRYVVELSQKLFGIVPVVRVRKGRQALVIYLDSTSLVDFLVTQGLPRGNKLKAGLKIPRWILQKKSYRLACVRGLVDTDGCLFIHTHRVSGKVYRNIGLTFTSYSPELIFQVLPIFEESGMMPHVTKRGRDIYLYRAESVARYFREIGTSNERITSVYRKWKELK